MRVFVLEPTKVDISDAERFGEIVYLFNNATRRPSIFSTTEFANLIGRMLESHDFDPKEDYVCVSGSLIKIVVFVATTVNCYDEIKLLLFSATDNNYVSRTLFKGDSSELAKCRQRA